MCRHAVVHSPDRAAPRRALAKILEETGETQEAIAVLQEGHRLFPEDAATAAALARLLGAADDVDNALAIARKWPHLPWSPALSLKLLLQVGREGEAAQFEQSVAAANPGDLNLFQLRSRRLRDDPNALLQLCDAVLDHHPGNSNAIYRKAVALARLGRGREAEAWMGIDSFVWVGALPELPGFVDDPNFRAKLRSEILANPTLRADPIAHATRNGLRTAVFPMPSDTAGAMLLRALRAAIANYAATLSGEHPFARHRPAHAALNAWALVFRAQGRQRVHVHPAGWATGVYYVAAPGESERAGGQLRVGTLSPAAGIAPPWPVLSISPKPGQLVLFPSFIPHDTVPTGSESERIAVAFDVVASS